MYMCKDHMYYTILTVYMHPLKYEDKWDKEHGETFLNSKLIFLQNLGYGDQGRYGCKTNITYECFWMWNKLAKKNQGYSRDQNIPIPRPDSSTSPYCCKYLCTQFQEKVGDLSFVSCFIMEIVMLLLYIENFQRTKSLITWWVTTKFLMISNCHLESDNRSVQILSEKKPIRITGLNIPSISKFIRHL